MKRTAVLRIIAIILLVIGCSTVNRAENVTKVFNGKEYVKYNDDWYLKSHGKLFKVIPGSISVIFKPGVTERDKETILTDLNRIMHIKVERVSKLGVYDLKIPDDADLFQYAAMLKERTVFSSVELNVFGEYFRLDER